VGRLDEEINARLQSSPVHVLIDLRAVDYISSTGWGLIAKYYDQVKGWGGTIALCGMNQDLFEIFSFLEFQSFIPTYMTREVAIASIEAQGAVIDTPRDAPPVEPTPAGAEDAPRDDMSDGDVDDVLTEPPLADETMRSRDARETVDEILGDVETAEQTPGEDVHEPPESPSPVDDLFEEPDTEMIPESQEMPASDWADTPAPATDDEPVAWDVEDVPAEPTQAPEGAAWSDDRDTEDVPAPMEPETQVEEPDDIPAEAPAELPVDRWGDEEVGDGVFVDFADESHRVDVDSATDDENLSEDEKLRDMGWSQYGQRLRKIVNREKSRRPKPRYDDDYNDDDDS
jgi:anti-anti-sigma factor